MRDETINSSAGMHADVGAPAALPILPVECRNFFGLTLPELEGLLTGKGKEKFRAQQLFAWVYQKHVTDFDLMTNLSKAFRNELPKLFEFRLPKVVTEHESLDGTRKYLFDIGQNQTVEAVLIPAEDRLTLCVSSEVGCNMACKFCFTAKQKLQRRLTAAEIVGQFLVVSQSLPEGKRISNVVFMGMGEPLDNPDEVFKSIEILHATWGMNISKRKITVSTSGIVPRIPLVASAGVRLAVSLNATTDEIRNQVMPINRKWPLKELMAACREYYHQTKDKITFEYVLLKGVTDSIEDARRLKVLTRSVPCKINLIAFNEHPGSGFHRPDDETIKIFQKELMDLGLHVLLRKSKGRDIYAACGQLRSKFEGHPGRMEISSSRL